MAMTDTRFLIQARGLDALTCGYSELRLSPSRGPVLRLRLDPNQDWKEYYQATLEDNVVALRRGDGEPLEFSFLGFESEEPSIAERNALEPTVHAVGVVLAPSIVSWFDQSLITPGCQWLIHQRAQDQSTFDFADQTLAGRLGPTIGSESLDSAFEEFGCLFRRSTWTNQQFLDHLGEFMGAHTATVWGWMAVDDARKPVRLLHGDTPFQLDDLWSADPGQVRPHNLLPGRLELVSDFKCEDPLEFFRRVSRSGNQADVSDLAGLVSSRSDQLCLVPGTVMYKGARHLCVDVRYAYDGPSVRATLVLEASVAHRRTDGNRSSQTVFLEGAFQQWAKEEDGERIILVKSAPSAQWVMVNENWSADEELALRSRVVMPGRSKGALKGYYIRHDEDDPMGIRLSEGQTPVAIGGMQYFNKALEESTLAVGAETIRIDASESITAKAKDIEMPFEESLRMGKNGDVINATNDKTVIHKKVEIS
jgi:hypothetical protein